MREVEDAALLDDLERELKRIPGVIDVQQSNFDAGVRTATVEVETGLSTPELSAALETLDAPRVSVRSSTHEQFDIAVLPGPDR